MPNVADQATEFRRCVVTGAVRPKDELIRFVAGPDGELVADLDAKLPGRGLWLSAERDIMAAASNGDAFSKSARRGIAVPGDLGGRVEKLMRRRCLNLVGLARRAGQLATGFEKVRQAAGKGEAAVLLAASDGAAGGRRKIRRLAPGVPMIEVFSAHDLGAAAGRERLVHAAVAPGGVARKLAAEGARLARILPPPWPDGAIE